ncbi:hypothetical protein KEM54_005087 [Ascosphaera aggregata]|nr:hypothetical protein KEM54_005087 [Ascosphaera aggregata]
MAPSLPGTPGAVNKRLDSLVQTVFSRPPEIVPFNCVTALLAVLPTVCMTFGSHYLHHRRLKGDPKRNLSYHEGLAVVDAFLYYSSFQTVEQMQAFTLQKVRSPRWAKVIVDTIPPDILHSAANLVINQLGDEGIARVGGKKWWQWRGPNEPPLSGEWIEMKSDFEERKRNGETGNRVILYFHGGAFYFGSVHSHRYQIQRHARLLKARAFAIDYRLAPQYPFPCALQDVIAAYLYLLALYSPNEIVIYGDSAGASLAISTLVTLRDQKFPLPAGTVLVSPWVDLTASFPSLGEEAPDDYLPKYGLMQAPSILFPPPNCDEIDQLMTEYRKEKGIEPRAPDPRGTAGSAEGGSQAYELDRDRPTSRDTEINATYQNVESPDHPHLGRRIPPLMAEISGELVEIKDQIWPYTTNDMMAHPLVSPVFQPSLGGLPPMMIIAGGGERLRDEQAYVAHKAADPTKYAPDQTILDKFDPTGRILSSYPPTKVHLQVYDGLCHDALALFRTWPVKCMYFSVAMFSARCLADAQQTIIDIPDSLYQGRDRRKFGRTYQWGRIGDPMPPYENNMIRQRVDPQGAIYPMEPPEKMRALTYPNTEIGRIQPQVAINWLAAKKLWDMQFKNRKIKVQKQRTKEIRQQIQQLEPDEIPPACSQASRFNLPTPKQKLPRGGHILTMYTSIGSAVDTRSLKRRAKRGHDLKIGADHPDEPVRRYSGFPSAGMPSQRRSTAYGILPRADPSQMGSRAGSRPPSVGMPEKRRGTSPKRLASIDITAGAGQGASQGAAQLPSSPSEEEPSIPDGRRRESSVAPPALLNDQNAGITDKSMQAKALAEPSPGSPALEGQRFASFARQGGASPVVEGNKTSPDDSDVSPGSTVPDENQPKYSSITAPIIPAKDYSPSTYGARESSTSGSGESPAAYSDPSDKYLRENRQRFPDYDSPTQQPRNGEEEDEGYVDQGDQNQGRPQPYRYTISGIAMDPNGATGDASTRTVIAHSGSDTPMTSPQQKNASHTGSTPMLPPKAPTRAAQARRKEAASKHRKSIVDEATANLSRVDSVLGHKAPIHGRDDERFGSLRQSTHASGPAFKS